MAQLVFSPLYLRWREANDQWDVNASQERDSKLYSSLVPLFFCGPITFHVSYLRVVRLLSHFYHLCNCTISAYVTEAATRAVVRFSPVSLVVSVSVLFRSRTAGSRHVWTRSRPRRRTQSRLLWMRSRASRAGSGIWALQTHWYREASVFEWEPRRRR